jgi:hypothetical protein
MNDKELTEQIATKVMGWDINDSCPLIDGEPILIGTDHYLLWEEWDPLTKPEDLQLVEDEMETRGYDWEAGWYPEERGGRPGGYHYYNFSHDKPCPHNGTGKHKSKSRALLLAALAACEAIKEK